MLNLKFYDRIIAFRLGGDDRICFFVDIYTVDATIQFVPTYRITFQIEYIDILCPIFRFFSLLDSSNFVVELNALKNSVDLFACHLNVTESHNPGGNACAVVGGFVLWFAFGTVEHFMGVLFEIEDFKDFS